MPEERAKNPTAPIGPLLENFAIGEVACQLTRAEEPVQLFQYRDLDKVEADTVLEHASGTVIGLEVKAAETVRAGDALGLRHLANRLGDGSWQESCSTPESSNSPSASATGWSPS
jgi:hypothetical protein